MVNKIEGIDPYKSLVLIERAVMMASMSQNEWYIGQIENQRIDPIVAAADWSVRYGKKVHNQFTRNIKNIYNYVQEHRREIQLDEKGLICFTDVQFREIMPSEKRSDSKRNILEQIAA